MLYRTMQNLFGEIRHLYPFNKETAEELINKLEIKYKISETFSLFDKNLKEIGLTKEEWENLAKDKRKDFLVNDIKDRESFYYYTDTEDDDSWITVNLKKGDYFAFYENGKYGDDWTEDEVNNYFKELTLDLKIKELKKENFIITSIINLSTIVNTKYDNIILDTLEHYDINNIEYPEKLEEITITDINDFRSIDWKDYNWLVVILDKKERYNYTYHLQLYKDLEKLEVKRRNEKC